jgi:hypothetical protein
MSNTDASGWRNGVIDTLGEPDGAYIALAREVWFQAIRDADAIRRGKVPDSYHNDMTVLKGKLSTRQGPVQMRRAAESVDEFLHCPDNAEDRELWAMLGFGLTGDEIARRVGG